MLVGRSRRQHGYEALAAVDAIAQTPDWVMELPNKRLLQRDNLVGVVVDLAGGRVALDFARFRNGETPCRVSLVTQGLRPGKLPQQNRKFVGMPQPGGRAGLNER